MSECVLQAENLSKHWGGLKALHTGSDTEWDAEIVPNLPPTSFCRELGAVIANKSLPGILSKESCAVMPEPSPTATPDPTPAPTSACFGVPEIDGMLCEKHVVVDEQCEQRALDRVH